MDPESVLYLSRRTLETALMLAAPVLAVTLTIGLLVAMIQAVTSIRDMTMGMVLKLAGVGVSLLLFGGWMMQVAIDFTNQIFDYMRVMKG